MGKEVVYCVRRGVEVKFVSSEFVSGLPSKCLATHSSHDFERELYEIPNINGRSDDFPGQWIHIRELKHGNWPHELYLECLTYGI